jgi:excisionase family DNA binding protein
MDIQISTTTATLIEGLLRPLAHAGTVHKSEVDAVLHLLKSATGDRNESDAPNRKLFTRTEAAKRLSLSTKTITRMIEAGELDARYLRAGSPRTLRITAESLARVEGDAQ